MNISTHFNWLAVYKYPYENRHSCPSAVVQSCHCATLEVGRLYIHFCHYDLYYYTRSLVPRLSRVTCDSLGTRLLQAMSLNNAHPTCAIAHCATRFPVTQSQKKQQLFYVCVRSSDQTRSNVKLQAGVNACRTCSL